ncbi:FHA domain-containing protein [Microbacterium sp. RU33B]|uniref:FHA domain-containing protein n=1 Tax=Microbacterium sp. RU33B TaxID=1907390 RepID=UPI000959BC29|nr:FHA domain-containing protein [Microbacterium sp. RU33B]SIT84468.1 FHA domain-containing protein [Microbacterium sp. RU33B]
MTRATTASAHYTPGDWRAAVVPSGAVVVDGAAAPALVSRLWDALGDDGGLHGLLDALTSAHAGAFSTLPPFAVVLREDGATRIAVRGEVTVAVAGGPTLSGAGVTTWTEQLIPGDGAVRVTTPGAAPDALDLVVRDGIVLASVVELRWTTDAAPATAAAPSVVDEQVAAPAVPPLEVAVDAPSAAEPAPEPEPAPVTAPEPASVAAPAPDAEPLRSADPLADGWLVDSLPAFGAPLPQAAPDPDIADTRVVTTHDDALTRDPFEVAAPIEDIVVERLGDHDGETISLAQARALREAAARSGDTVPPLAPPRMPAPGRLRLSTGVIVPLDRTVVIGRRPRSTRVSGTDLPRLVAVDSPQQDISRSHLELRVEGDTIVATDLQTTNGTLLLRAGSSPTRLHPGEQTVVVPGDVLDLGDGITVDVEELA